MIIYQHTHIYIYDIAIYDDNVVSFFWSLHHTWHVSVGLQYTKRYGQALGVASDLGPNPSPTKRSIWTSSKSEVKRTMPSSPEFWGDVTACFEDYNGDWIGIQWNRMGFNADFSWGFSMDYNGSIPDPDVWWYVSSTTDPVYNSLSVYVFADMIGILVYDWFVSSPESWMIRDCRSNDRSRFFSLPGTLFGSQIRIA